MDHARAAICLSGMDGERLPALALDLDAESAHQVQGDLDIGLGNQLADHLDGHVLPRQRGGHQQRREKLAGNIAAHLDRPDARIAAGLTASGGKPSLPR